MEGLLGSIGHHTNNSTLPHQESSTSKRPISRIETGGILDSTRTQTQNRALDHFRENDGHPNTDPDPDPAPLATAGDHASNSDMPRPQPEENNVIRYRECLKNHAASIGGSVMDGCGEFMPSGEEGTAAALKCAACECHRSFHRREAGGGEVEYSQQFMRNYYHPLNPIDNNGTRSITNHHIQLQPINHHRQHFQQHHQSHQFSHHYSPSLASPVMGPVMMAFGGPGRDAAESSSEDLTMYHYNAGGATQQMVVPPSFSASKKRFRTKFSKEQKDRMHEVAERLGWKIQKQDDEEVQKLCNELGVKRQVFRVWLHNNKQAMKKKQHDE